MAKGILVGKVQTLTVHQEGERVQLIANGQLVADMPWDAALALAHALRIKAKEAEETIKAEAIAIDQAILLRLGVPIGLTDHPDIRAEARKEAAWNSDLRRYIPPGRAGGLASQAEFGRPTIIKKKRRKGDG